MLAIGLPCCHAACTLSGYVQDRLKAPIDGALVTIWIPGGVEHIQTTSAGRYSFSGIKNGDYLLKVEKTGMARLYGAVRLTGEDHHEFNLVLAKSPGLEPIVKAESPYDLPAQESRLSNSPTRKVKPARLLKQVSPKYPVAVKSLGIGASVQIAGMISTNGTFDDIVVLSAPSPELALSTLLAVRQWRYSPTYVDGNAVAVVTITDVLFHPR
jgi:hypothetical protein